jgi:DNA-binding NtrC family response regulator
MSRADASDACAPGAAAETQARALPRVVHHSKFLLSVRQGPDAGQARELAGSPVRVGSASDNDLVLADDTVSRRHCAIEPLPAGVRVRDEGSTNGTFVDGVRIFDALFTGPVELRLGDSVLAIAPSGESVAREQLATDRFFGLVGDAPAMRELFADLARIAPTDVTVLIEGETGTGKEVVAESLHAASRRAGGAFVVFDCGAVAPSLVESELFGHERGAFTGAVASRAGVFEQADGGTLFLDELGELPKDLQPKLLRALERREVRRLGSQRVLPVDVRLVAATHRNLAAEVQRGNFRQDLYYRLAAARVRVPPLRDRMQDLPLLVAHFLQRCKPARSAQEVPPQVWELLRAHRWPGNVRELGHAVERFLITPERVLSEPGAPSTPLEPAADALPSQPLREARRDASEAFERAYVAGVLRRTQGNVTRAAAIAEVSRQMLQKLMRKHGMS